MSIEPDNPELPLSAEGGSAARGFSLLSHDLRSALSDILGGIRLIDSDRLDRETRGHLERITAAGEVLARLLDKAADEAGAQAQPAGNAVNLTLSDFLDDIRKRWSARAREKGVAFDIVADSALPAIVTLDRVALDRVIANLLGNAVKFTDRGRVELRVACDEARRLSFTIRDDGPGLSPEALARLFQFQGRPGSNGKPGSGLGLFIARELSQKMGAHLRVANRPEGGAEAELLFPQDSWFERSLRRDPAATAPDPGESPDLSGLNILLAEDNKTNQLVATQMLKALGADFAVASDGLEALEILERQRFDLALLDIEMPRMTGLELIRELRSRPEPLASMPLVALTAYVMREHRERIFAAGADGIIAKPIMSIDALGRAVRDHLGGGAPAPAPVPAPAPEPEQAGAGVVERARFDSLVRTIGADSIAELLAKLQSDTDAVAEGLGRGRASLDLAEIRSQTHILISVAGAIGATGLQHLAQRLNAAANRQDAPDIDSLCGECLAGLKALQGFILEEQAKAEAVA